jgi:AraC family transcriptional activator of pobA
MEEIIKLETVTAYNKMRGVETLHPLVSVMDLSKAQPMPAKTFNFGLYGQCNLTK